MARPPRGPSGHSSPPVHGTPPAPAPTPAAPAAPASPTGGGHTRLQQAAVEAEQGTVVALFQSYRLEIAGFLLDLPGAQFLTNQRIAKALPAIALVFKITTKPGEIMDVVDDIVQDLAQAVKEESMRRAAGGVQTAVHPAPATTTADPYTRFLFASMALAPANFTTMMNWHDALSPDEKAQLYTLVGQANDKQLAAMVKLPTATIKTAAAKMPKVVKPMTYTQLRDEVLNDATLAARVTTFQTAKAVDALRFWKAVEATFPDKIKDKKDVEIMMSSGDDKVADFLHLGTAQASAPLVTDQTITNLTTKRNNLLGQLKKMW